MPDRQSTATIKFGGNDAPWLVFAGDVDDIRDQIIKAFGIEVVDDTLAELVAQASGMAQGLWTIVRNGGGGMGGTVIRDTPQTGQNGTSDSPAATQAANPYGGVLEAIEKAESKADLQAIYVKHNAAYKDSADVQAAFAAKSKTF